MSKVYETPKLVTMTLELGVYGNYGDSGGGGDDGCGGHHHGHGGGHHGGGGGWH